MKSNNKIKYIIYIILLILLIISFIMLFKSELYNIVNEFDNKISLYVKANSNDNLIFLFKIFTFIGDFYIPILIIVCSFIFIKNKYYSYLLGISYLISGTITYILKYIISRQRPLSALISIPSSYSFPSGHTLTSTVFYILLCYLFTKNMPNYKKIIYYVLTYILILLIGISRIYLGVHYFFDVIGGLILGLVIVYIIINIIEKHYKERLL